MGPPMELSLPPRSTSTGPNSARPNSVRPDSALANRAVPSIPIPHSAIVEYRAALLLYLQRQFKVSRREARTLLASWMEDVETARAEVAPRPLGRAAL